MNNGKRVGTVRRKAMLGGGPVPVRTSKGNADVLARLKRLDRTQRHAVLAKTDRTGPLVSLDGADERQEGHRVRDAIVHGKVLEHEEGPQ